MTLVFLEKVNVKKSKKMAKIIKNEEGEPDEGWWISKYIFGNIFLALKHMLLWMKFKC